jgi:hypothetical protein
MEDQSAPAELRKEAGAMMERMMAAAPTKAITNTTSARPKRRTLTGCPRRLHPPQPALQRYAADSLLQNGPGCAGLAVSNLPSAVERTRSSQRRSCASSC